MNDSQKLNIVRTCNALLYSFVVPAGLAVNIYFILSEERLNLLRVIAIVALGYSLISFWLRYIDGKEA